MNKLSEYLKYYFKNNRIIFFSAALAIAIICSITNFGTELPEPYTNLWDPIFTVFSIFLVFGLTFIYVKKEWENSLNQELIVHFKHEDKFIFSCYGVNLLPNADIRALAQQIGAQMNDNKFFKFNPSINLLKKEVIQVFGIDNKKVWINYYEVEVILTEDIGNEIYKVWNVNSTEICKRVFKNNTIKFTKQDNDISIANMLSYNKRNFERFKEIDSTAQKKISLLITDNFIIEDDEIEISSENNINILSLIEEDNLKFLLHYNVNAPLLSLLFNKRIVTNRETIHITKKMLDENEGLQKCIVLKLKTNPNFDTKYAKSDISKLFTCKQLIFKLKK